MGNTGTRFSTDKQIGKEPCKHRLRLHALLTIIVISEIPKSSKPSRFAMEKDRTAPPLPPPLPLPYGVHILHCLQDSTVSSLDLQSPAYSPSYPEKKDTLEDIHTRPYPSPPPKSDIYVCYAYRIGF